jgi:NDP-sugar pyrophosphorylase family protein
VKLSQHSRVRGRPDAAATPVKSRRIGLRDKVRWTRSTTRSLDQTLAASALLTQAVIAREVAIQYAAAGALRKRREHQVVPFVYAGAAIMSPAIFADAPAGDFSLTRMFDRANEQERLFGLRLDGVWMHVGTPDAIAAAEEAYLESVA